MNHILRLQNDFACAGADLKAIRDGVQAFRAHLTLPKFAGIDADGSRRDWIAIADVDAWLTAILAGECDAIDGARAS